VVVSRLSNPDETRLIPNCGNHSGYEKLPELFAAAGFRPFDKPKINITSE
jgi:hypothetical protein